MLDPSYALANDYYDYFFLLFALEEISIFVELVAIIFLAISSSEREFSKF